MKTRNSKILIYSSLVIIVLVVIKLVYDANYSPKAILQNKISIIKRFAFNVNLEQLEGKYYSYPSDNNYNEMTYYEIKKEDKGCGLLLYGYNVGFVQSNKFANCDGYLFVKDYSLYIGEDPDICPKPEPPHKEGAAWGVGYSSNNVYYDPVNKAILLGERIYHKD